MSKYCEILKYLKYWNIEYWNIEYIFVCLFFVCLFVSLGFTAKPDEIKFVHYWICTNILDRPSWIPLSSGWYACADDGIAFALLNQRLMRNSMMPSNALFRTSYTQVAHDAIYGILNCVERLPGIVYDLRNSGLTLWRRYFFEYTEDGWGRFLPRPVACGARGQGPPTKILAPLLW